jgi:enoyl-CoA hydratase
MGQSLVELESHGTIAYVTLNRPEKLNALSPELLRDLRGVWKQVAGDDTIRVAILRGAGRAFCVGADLGGRGGPHAPRRTPGADRRHIREMMDTFFMAWELPKPVISQVHGFAFAGGSLLATLTDMIVVADDTVIGWPRLPVGGGLIGPTWSWFVGPHLAKEFSFTVGRTMTGSDAVRFGWGNRAVPAARLEEEVLAAAEKIAKVPSDLISLKKAAVNNQMEAAGFKEAVMRGTEMDAIAHTTETVQVVNRRIAELGIKGAIDWFEREGLS